MFPNLRACLEEFFDTWDSYIVAVIDSGLTNPCFKVRDRNGKIKFIPQFEQLLFFVFNFKLEPSKEHSQEVRVGISSLFLFTEVDTPLQLGSFGN